MVVTKVLPPDVTVPTRGVVVMGVLAGPVPEAVVADPVADSCAEERTGTAPDEEAAARASMLG